MPTHARCVFTGEPIFEVTRDPNLPEEDQLHFNPRAFAMAQPLSATVGNFGNVPNGILRQPGWWNWDLTLARRFPVPHSADDAQARAPAAALQHLQHGAVHPMNTDLQFQDDPNVPGLDNLLLTSTDHGRYTTTNNNIGDHPPRQFGVTFRLDF